MRFAVHGLMPGGQRGQPVQGFYLLTPLRLADGSKVVVNRGFVPTQLRDPASRPESQPQAEATVTGLVRSPEKRDLVQARERSEPRRLVHPRPGRDRAGQGPRPRRALRHRRRRHPQSGRLAEGRPDAAHDDERPSRLCADLVRARARARRASSQCWSRAPVPAGAAASLFLPARTPKVRARSPPRPSVLHVSTRGEAPAIGFTDALLAGLARDGGLYVPEPGRRFRATPSRLSPAAATPRSRRPSWARSSTARSPRADLGRMIAAAYATFRHPSVAPLVQIGDNLFVLELFHGPTLAFKDVAMQSAGAAHGSRPDGARRPRHHRRRDLGRHRQRGGRRLHRARPGRRLHPVPARPRLRRAAAADDDRRRRQRACHRRRRHLRRLPGAREGDVQPRGLPRRAAALRRELDQLGPHRRADRLLLHRRGGARGAASSGVVLGADRQFRRRARRLRRQAHGAADRAADGRDQRQRHPRPRARPAAATRSAA